MTRTSRSTTWTRAAGTARGTTWTRRATAAVAGLLGVLVPTTTALAAPAPDAGPRVSWIVRAHPGHLGELLQDARQHGTVTARLDLIDGLVVRATADAAAALARDAPTASVTRNRSVSLLSAGDKAECQDGPVATLAQVAAALGADVLQRRGTSGAGVGIALVDSGIARVDGVGQVEDGVDLSSDRATKPFVDTFGHGTHLAGILHAVAPSARLVNVRVADGFGQADVSQVIAGLGWVAGHARSGGIRVVNLSFGTDSGQAYTVDPLAYAAERLWQQGIVVVASAGNTGHGRNGLTDPAYDPYVLAVGATDTTTRDLRVASFSARGDGTRNPDVVAPGAHVASLRVPGSAIDTAYGDKALTQDGMFRGSGTSQSAAAVSASVALLLSGRPDLTPDQVKGLLSSTADAVGGAARAQGRGAVDLPAALAAPAGPATQQAFPASDGSGSLEAARGSAHTYTADGPWTGERDFTGQNWGSQNWASQNWASQAWASQNWASSNWASQNWASSNWASSNWASSNWASQNWASSNWASSNWASSNWADDSWS